MQEVQQSIDSNTACCRIFRACWHKGDMRFGITWTTARCCRFIRDLPFRSPLKRQFVVFVFLGKTLADVLGLRVPRADVRKSGETMETSQRGLTSNPRWNPEAVSSPSVKHHYCSRWLNAASGERVWPGQDFFFFLFFFEASFEKNLHMRNAIRFSLHAILPLKIRW